MLRNQKGDAYMWGFVHFKYTIVYRGSATGSCRGLAVIGGKIRVGTRVCGVLSQYVYSQTSYSARCL